MFGDSIPVVEPSALRLEYLWGSFNDMVPLQMYLYFRQTKVDEETVWQLQLVCP